mgnify:CR=1 FL=1
MTDFFSRFNPWAFGAGGLITFGMFETAKGYYVAGSLTAVVGGALAFIEYKIEAENEHREMNKAYVSDFISRNMRN